MTTHPCNGWDGASSGLCGLTTELIAELIVFLGNVALDAFATGLSHICALTAELIAPWGKVAMDAAAGIPHT